MAIHSTIHINVVQLDRLDPKACPYCGVVDDEPATHFAEERCHPPKREPLVRPANGWPWEQAR